jgi:Hemopexin
LKYHAKAACSDYEKLYRKQCLCPPGHINGGRNASGAIQCISRKYIALFTRGSTNAWYIFIEDLVYYLWPSSKTMAINDEFFGVWSSGVDAVALLPPNYYWFFKGREVLLYYKTDSGNETMVSGSPKNIADVLTGNDNLTYGDSAFYSNENDTL